MSEQNSSLEFPTSPGYYSVIQTSWPLRFLVITWLLVMAVLVSWSFGNSYLEAPEEFGPVGLIIWILIVVALLAFVLAVWLVRPFLVKDGTVYLMKAVKQRSGRQTRKISFSEISNVSLIQDARDNLQIWVTLSDGTRFHMVTMAEEEHKEFARRFADRFQDYGQ